jgi:uncharacterized protein YaaR (DUF327 family)
MDAFDILVKQIDEKVEQLSDFLAQGRAETYEEYKKMCGEIKGLLIARGNTLDLKHNMEHSDE